MNGITDVVNSFLLIYAGLFPIVNPVGGAPIFLALTRHSSDAERHALAARVALNGFFLLLGSLFVGSYVLEFFGITLPVVRVGGGIVVIAFAWKVLDPTEGGSEQRVAGSQEQTIPPIDAFYPLTLPLTVGPGSISVAITLGSQRPTMADGVGHLLLLGAGAVAGLAAIAATIFLCYRFADRIVAALGASGTNVLVRLTAFILLCIGIQIVWNGYGALVASH
jgi:multiple antibiotic resistance protein